MLLLLLTLFKYSKNNRKTAFLNGSCNNLENAFLFFMFYATPRALKFVKLMRKLSKIKQFILPVDENFVNLFIKMSKKLLQMHEKKVTTTNKHKKCITKNKLTLYKFSSLHISSLQLQF